MAIEEMLHQMKSKLLELHAKNKRLKIDAFQRTEERDVCKQLIDNHESARDKENIESYCNADEIQKRFMIIFVKLFILSSWYYPHLKHPLIQISCNNKNTILFIEGKRLNFLNCLCFYCQLW